MDSRVTDNFVTDNLSVTDINEPCKVANVRKDREGEVFLDLEKDLKLNLRKDLGVTSWSDSGIFISPDITEKQVRAIRDIVAAKNGWPEERNFLYWCGVHRQYKPCECV